VEKKPTKIAWEDEDDDGLEIPSGPLRLKPNLNGNASASNAEDDDFDAVDEEGDAPPLLAQDPENGFDEVEVEDDDWNDVALPASLGEPVTKRVPEPKVPQSEVEEWDDFEIPHEKIELKVLQNHHQRQHKSTRGTARGEDDDFDGIDIPEGVQLQLRMKR